MGYFAFFGFPGACVFSPKRNSRVRSRIHVARRMGVCWKGRVFLQVAVFYARRGNIRPSLATERQKGRRVLASCEIDVGARADLSEKEYVAGAPQFYRSRVIIATVRDRALSIRGRRGRPNHRRRSTLSPISIASVTPRATPRRCDRCQLRRSCSTTGNLRRRGGRDLVTDTFRVIRLSPWR